jgi:serine/threonine-protein kinase
VCASLAEAHAIGLVHRDVKPANVMLCVRGGVPDFVKVLDFGLAKELSGMGDAGVSQSSAFLGTPLYAAPEAITAPASVDARADLYALGAVACFLLTGEPPFGGGSVVEVCARHVGAAPEPPSARALGIPPALDAVVLRCLEKDPARRFASADELRVALAAIAVAPWSRDDAAAWWRERGDALTREVRERARRAADTGGEGRRVVIDPRARA